MEMRDHKLQPGMSADRASERAYAGHGSMPAPPRHASVGAYAGLGSVPAPPARRAEELMSENSNDTEESGELLGEVRSILNSRDGVRKGIRSGNGHAGVMTRQRCVTLDTACRERMWLDDIKLFENASVLYISLLTHLAPVFIHGDGGGEEK